MAGARSPVAFGQYIITRRIARGGMAEIYRARTRSSGEHPSRWVAVKMMRPSIGHEELREHLFKREAKIASMIQHANVVPLFEFGLEMERHYISMEYVRGRDLSHLLKNDKRGREPLSFELGLFIGLQAAAGLGYAQRLIDERGELLGIVHRDISPGNVMVSYDGQVKVLDFGVARMNESEGMRTQTGTLRGKFAYMSPEQTLGESLDARSDVFSLGTVLYELLTGSNCFRAENPIATLERVQRVRPVPPSRANRDIPKSVDRILARCLAKDRKRRFQDCTVLHEALGEFLDKRNFVGKEALSRHMADRFLWEKSEEEKELQKEEEEVALFDVIDFAMVEDGGLDAPHVAVSLQEEASQAEVNKSALHAAEEDDRVFDSDEEDPENTDEGGRKRASSPARRMALEQRRAQIGSAPVDPDSGEMEATVATPRRFEDPDDVGPGQEVALSSLLAQNASATETAIATAAPSIVGRPEVQRPWDFDTREIGVGRQEVRRRASGLLQPAAIGADTGEQSRRTEMATAAVSQPRISPPRRRATAMTRPAVLALALVAAVLSVATFVTIGVDAQSKSEDAGEDETSAKRTTIAPVTITLEEEAASQNAGKARRTSREDRAAEPARREDRAPEPIRREVAADTAARETGAVLATQTPPRPPEPAETEAAAPPGDDDDAPRGATHTGHSARSAPARSVPVTPRAAAAPSKPSPSPSKATAKVTSQAKSKQTGFLNVGAKPWAEIAINGRPWPYQTPQAGIELPVGKHTVTLSNRETGVTKTQTVQIKHGEYTTVSMDLRKR